MPIHLQETNNLGVKIICNKHSVHWMQVSNSGKIRFLPQDNSSWCGHTRKRRINFGIPVHCCWLILNHPTERYTNDWFDIHPQMRLTRNNSTTTRVMVVKTEVQTKTTCFLLLCVLRTAQVHWHSRNSNLPPSYQDVAENMGIIQSQFGKRNVLRVNGDMIETVSLILWWIFSF